MRNTKDQILELAMHYIRKYGYDSFSYADISKELGITKASIHYYYKNKEDLLIDIIDEYIMFQSNLNERLSEIDNPKEKIKKFFIYEYEGTREEEKCPIVMIENILYKMNEQIRNKFIKLVNVEIDNLSNILEEYFKEKNKKNIAVREESIKLLSLYKGNMMYSRALNGVSSIEFILNYIEKNIK